MHSFIHLLFDKNLGNLCYVISAKIKEVNKRNSDLGYKDYRLIWFGEANRREEAAFSPGLEGVHETSEAHPGPTFKKVLVLLPELLLILALIV